MNNEKRLLLILSKPTLTDKDIEQASFLFANGQICWDTLFSLSIHHKTIVTVYKNLRKMGVRYDNKWGHFIGVYAGGNSLRNQFLYDCVTPAMNGLFEAGIIAVPLKGAYLNHKVYESYDIRQCGDFDVLVKEEDITSVIRVLEQHGFIQSKARDLNGDLIPASRQLKAYHRLYTHELVPFMKRVDNPLLNYIEIDVHFDIFSRSQNHIVSLPQHELFRTATPFKINRERLLCHELSVELNLIQISSHIYRDNTILQNILQKKDHILRDYIDLRELIVKHKDSIEWGSLCRISTEYGVNNILYYTFYYLEQLYGELIPAEFMQAIAPQDRDYLNRYGFEEIESQVWDLPFIERLFKNRSECSDFVGLTVTKSYSNMLRQESNTNNNTER
ncbi:nucleotidyltransferase family protein [Paenibacillus glucanolyticus]|uniref:nucleotidyltransferase family protein n=1 Tax=Paenibacillus glucanolyticus TaxID=59843 RepID=UPI0036761F2A